MRTRIKYILKVGNFTQIGFDTVKKTDVDFLRNTIKLSSSKSAKQAKAIKKELQDRQHTSTIDAALRKEQQRQRFAKRKAKRNKYKNIS